MGLELLIQPLLAADPASWGHVRAAAKRVTAVPPDRMSGTSDTTKGKKKGHLHFHFHFPRFASLSRPAPPQPPPFLLLFLLGNASPVSHGVSVKPTIARNLSCAIKVFQIHGEVFQTC